MFKKLFKKEVKQEAVTEKSEPKMPVDNTESEISAAIGLALHMYLEQIHDFEKTVLTIQTVMRPYSPWSSKIYGLRKYPR